MKSRPVAERVGFEPTVRFHVRRISSAVHSTTLPPLRGADIRLVERGASLVKGGAGRKRFWTRNSIKVSALSGQGQAGCGTAQGIGADEAEKLGRTTAGVAGKDARGLDQTGAFDAATEVLLVQ